MSAKNSAPWEWIAGLRRRSSEYLTSAAVNGRPVVKRTSGRSVKVTSWPSGLIVHEAASSGTMFVPAS